jgi:hydrogenase maturation factor HypF (carbamoyltransferase family)
MMEAPWVNGPDDRSYYETPDPLVCPNCDQEWEDPEKRRCFHCGLEGCSECIKYNGDDELVCKVCK